MEIINDLSTCIKDAENFVLSKNNRVTFNHNNLIFEGLKNKGVVYFIFVTDNSTKQTKLRYIGKSKGNLFKQRLKNHFDHAHVMTATKQSEVKNELNKGNKVEYSFLTTQPESLRNSIEEELISLFKEKTSLWNGKRINKNKTKG